MYTKNPKELYYMNNILKRLVQKFNMVPMSGPHNMGTWGPHKKISFKDIYEIKHINFATNQIY